MKLQWNTALGFKELSSGELAPGVDPIKLKFYPYIGYSVNDWEFFYGIYQGVGKVKKLTKDQFNFDDQSIELTIQFDNIKTEFGLTINAQRVSTKEIIPIWHGLITPNYFDQFEIKLSDLFIGNCSIADQLRNNLNTDYRLFRLPKLDVIVPNKLIMLARASNDNDHVASNAPILFKDMHVDQCMDLLVKGCVIGYGGKGGDAGYSIGLNQLSIVYPTNGLSGGNPIFVEHPLTQTVNVTVDKNTGMWEAGGGGGPASEFLIEHRFVPYQYGRSGAGGLPTGLTGKDNSIFGEKGIKLNKEHASPVLNSDENSSYYFYFKESFVDKDSHTGEVHGVSTGGSFTSNNTESSGNYIASGLVNNVIPASKAGQSGQRVPSGVKLKDTGKRKRNSIIGYGLKDDVFMPISKNMLKVK